MNFSSARTSYERAELLESLVEADPFVQLKGWLDEALALDLPDANAMCIATADALGQPSARMVLLRGLDERGLVFYTSYFSRKARDIETNPKGAALFYWPQFERQVRVEGTLRHVPEDESDAYFAGRPRGHQLGAWASEQSEPVESRALLDERIADFAKRFEGEEVPRPHSWGGYRLEPRRFEFWQGRPNRMHDRLEYRPSGRGWTIGRLQP